MDGGVMTMQPPPNKQYHHMARMPNYQRPAVYIPNARTPLPPKGITNTQQSDAGVAGGNPFDGKRMRKAVHRKTIDYNTTVINYLQNRIWQRDFRDSKVIQPDGLYHIELVPPLDMVDDPMNCVTTRFMRQSTNKFRCPIFCLAWTPEGRRLVTGASSGEFTLWNGLTFNFETILQAHDTSVRAMVWSHNDQWMVTGDHIGYIKYWQSNMNNVKMYQGHKEAIRCISFCPTDAKFATCSDDGTIRVWDFLRCLEEKILRGHGADVKCVDWHPQKSLIASGSKDNQQPIKLWDPKSGQSLATLHAHKATVMDLQWNKNGNWLLTAARDHLMKLFDIRNMKEEMQIFKGHKKEATAVAWHPAHEDMFASGGSDGAILFWNVGTDKEVGGMEEAHDAIIWDLAWHPLGHILASASNDHSTKFWTRNRPGDRMRDKYNLNTLPVGPDGEILDIDMELMEQIGGIGGNPAHLLPGMGLEHGLPPEPELKREPEEELPSIPGLDWSTDEKFFQDQQAREAPRKKVPYSRPIPKSFEQAWISNKQSGVLVPDEQVDADDKEAGGAASKLKSPAGFGAPRRETIPSLMSLPTKGPNSTQMQEKDEPKLQTPQNVGPGGPRGPNQGMGLLGPAPGALLPNQTPQMRPPGQPQFLARPGGTGQGLQPNMPHPNQSQGPRPMGPGQWTPEGNGPDIMGQNLQQQQQQKQGLLRPPVPTGPQQPGMMGQPRMPVPGKQPVQGGPRGPSNQRMPLHPGNQPQGLVNQPRPQVVNMGQDMDFRGNPSHPHIKQEQQRQQQQQEFMDTGDFDHRTDRDFREDRDFRTTSDYGQNNRVGEMFPRNRGGSPSVRGRGRGSYDDRSGAQGHLGQQETFNSYGRSSSDSSRQWASEDHEMMDTDVRIDRDDRNERSTAPNFSRGRGTYNDNRGQGGPFSDNRGQTNVNENRDSYERDDVWGGNQGNRSLGNYGGLHDQDRRQYSESSDPSMGGRKGNWKEGPGDGIPVPEEVGLGMNEQFGGQQTSWAEDMSGRQDFQSERGGYQPRGGLRGSPRGRGGEMRGRGVDRGRGMVHKGGRGVAERAGYRGGGGRGSWN